jgi:hypothetical protein
MKTGSEKSSTTTPSTLHSSSQPFFGKTTEPQVQTKMTVNTPGDKLEQEADKKADQVMRMPQVEEKIQKAEAKEDKIQKKEDEKLQKAESKEEKIQKKEEDKLQKAEAKEDKIQKKEEEKVQRRGNGTPSVGSSTQSAIQNKTTGGEPLSSETKSFMEPRFGADFSNVRIHNDQESASLNNNLNARAFTYQNHIFFSENQYQPGTGDGKQLLAHELTHTIQQGHANETPIQRSSTATVQRAPSAAPKEVIYSSEVVDISANTFSPSAKVKEEIEAQGHKGLEVRVIIKGLTAEGRVKIRVDSTGQYDSLGKGSMALLNEWTQQMGGMYLNFTVKNNAVSGGYASLKPGGGDTNDWVEALKKNSALLGGLGLKINNLPKPVNTFENGTLTLGVTGLKVEVGGFLDATFNLLLENANKPKIDATAQVDVKGAAKGELKLDNTKGGLAGEVALAVNLKSFSGAVNAKYNADGFVEVGGKAAYNADKLSGEIQFVSTDVETANKFAKDAIAAAGGKENVQEAPPPAPVPAPKPGKKQRGLAATGQLSFHLTNWFAGSVFVVVDAKGDLTVIGKIAPPAEIELFKQRDWDKELIKFEAKAYYGLPVVGNLNLFANISLHALASLGPAKIYKIEILGTYSTDPEIQKNIQISASLNISAYAGLRLRAEGGAGIEILDHDLKFGVGLNADLGIKAYAEARPTIGYRDPGEFYVSGSLEMVAQPMLGLGGDFFIELETPWWSPLSDDKWVWPLFSKEWPLGDPIGLNATVKDYVLGSGKVPEVEMKKPEFDPSKFMTNMVDRTLPDKSGGQATGQGSFKEDGSVPKPVVPPKQPEPPKTAPKGGKKGAPSSGGKSGKPDPKAAQQQDAAKLLKTNLDALSSKAPFTKEELTKELDRIKGKVPGVSFEVQPKDDKWVVSSKAGAGKKKDTRKIELAMKKPGKDEKYTSEFDKKAKQVKVAFSMNGEGHTITLQKQGDKYKLLMSSKAPGILLSKIDSARAEISENIKNNKLPKKQGQTWAIALESLNKQAQDVSYADQYLADFRLQEERTIPYRNLSIEGFESRITKITSSLERMGSNYGITSLQDIWANDHPSKFVKAKQLLPEYRGSASIRAKFYPSMSTLYSTHRDPKLGGSFLSNKVLINGNKANLAGRVYSGTPTGKLSDPDFGGTHFISEATYPEESVFSHPKIIINGVDYATIPKNGSLDHVNSVAKSWNSHGRFKKQADRETTFKTPPFQLVSVELNSSRAANEPSYDPTVGDDFRGPNE